MRRTGFLLGTATAFYKRGIVWSAAEREISTDATRMKIISRAMSAKAKVGSDISL
jgi:hypothetical protein